MSVIVQLNPLEILDSRGNPTVECEVILASGIRAHAAVPSGASVGCCEAKERRDGDGRFLGKGVQQALHAIRDTIQPAIRGLEVTEQEAIDRTMVALDGQEDRSKLGANAILAVSLAVAKTAAVQEQVPFYRYLGGEGPFLMPVPMMNIINGGAHASNNVDIQEFMLFPAGVSSFSEAIRCGAEIFHCLKKQLQQKGESTLVGDEGGFAPDLRSNIEAIERIMSAVELAGYRIGTDVFLTLDIASSAFYRDGKYHLASEDRSFSVSQWIDYLVSLVNQYPIVSIEDGMAEDDWAGWQALTKRLGKRIQLVGDDVFVTQAHRLRRGIKDHIANAILIKPNQVGTLTETLETIGVARLADYGVVISHRSGETEDVSIADLAVATSAGQIKAGSLSRSDRLAKYNALLRIEAQLSHDAIYAGRQVLYDEVSN